MKKMLQMEAAADDMHSTSVATTTINNNQTNSNHTNNNNNNSETQSVSCENLNPRNIKSLIIPEVTETVVAVTTNLTTTTTTTSVTSSSINHKNVLYSIITTTTTKSACPVLIHACSAPSLQQQQQQSSPTPTTTTITTPTPCEMYVHRSYSNVSVTPKMFRKSIDSEASLRRRVSFPKYDNELVTGYLEPANPWQHTLVCEDISEMAELYERSCRKHNTNPLSTVQDHLKAIELNKDVRQPLLCLKSIKLAPNDCEALEEIFKRVQYKSIDLSACDLNESAASALFEMIEYYEATNELDISSNAKGMTHRGWVSCTFMISHSRALQVLNAQGNPISKSGAENLGHALTTSNLHTIKLEHCGLKGAPLSALCLKLRHNRVLKELWLAYNDLDCVDADTIADLLKVNHYLELVDISNNNIQDVGLQSIVRALIIQSAEVERKAKVRREDLEKGKTATFEVGDSSMDNEDDDDDDNETVVNANINAQLSTEEDYHVSNSKEQSIVAEENENLTVNDSIESSDNSKLAVDCDLERRENSSAVQQQIVGLSMLDKLLSMNSDNACVFNNSVEQIAAEQQPHVALAESKQELNIDNSQLLVDISEPTTTNGDSTLLDVKLEDEQNSKVNYMLKTSSKHTEEFDDTHSTDSAFESASEGDISRHLSEEYGRLTASVTMESGIETGVIAAELPENLLLDIETPTLKNTPPAVTSIQHSEEQPFSNVDTVNCYIDTRPLMSVMVAESQTDDNNRIINNAEEKSIQQQTSAEAPVPKTLNQKSNDIDIVPHAQSTTTVTASPIPSPTSFSMRRNETCNFITQASRNYSQSTDSLCSENSLDGSITSNDLSYSNNSQLNEKLTKNDTLTRQQRPVGIPSEVYNNNPNGLKALAIWNNNLTKEAGLYISDLLAVTESLELLNIGKNCLSNEFLQRIKEQLTRNTTLTTLGLQSAHLSEQGIDTLVSILTFGGNHILQRIDIRDNKLTVESLMKIEEVLKSNTSITEIDIDDEPKRLSVGTEEHQNYTRILQNIRSMCARNEQHMSQNNNKTAIVQEIGRGGRRGYNVGSRKISLTCYNRAFIDTCLANSPQLGSTPTTAQIAVNKLEVKRKSGCRLRSPVPSPSAISPSSSPNRSRFQVFRVSEPSANTLAASCTVTVAGASPIISMRTPSPLSPLTSLPSTAALAIVPTNASKRLASSPRTRFQVCRIYEDPKIPLVDRSLPPITPPINPPPTPMSKNMQRHEAQQLSSSPTTTINITTSIESEMLTKKSLTTTAIAAEKAALQVEREETDVSETSSSPSTCSTSSSNSSVSPPPCATITQFPNTYYEENDVTLTEKTREHFKSSVLHIDAVDGKENAESDDSTNNAKDTRGTTEQRARKSSWIAHPATVDKLLNIFQNPAAFFQRSVSPEPKEIVATTTAVQAYNPNNCTVVSSFPVHKTPQWQTESFPVSSKQSSPIPWCSNSAEIAKTLASTAAAATLVQSRSFLDNASRQFKDLGKQVFGTNFPLTTEKNLVAAEELNADAEQLELPNENSNAYANPELREQ